MLKQGFLTQRKGSLAAIRRERSANRSAKLMLWIGVAVLFVALLVMLLNTSGADKIVSIWTPFVIAGTALVFGSLLHLVVNKKHHNRIRS